MHLHLHDFMALHPDPGRRHFSTLTIFTPFFFFTRARIRAVDELFCTAMALYDGFGRISISCQRLGFMRNSFRCVGSCDLSRWKLQSNTKFAGKIFLGKNMACARSGPGPRRSIKGLSSNVILSLCFSWIASIPTWFQGTPADHPFAGLEYISMSHHVYWDGRWGILITFLYKLVLANGLRSTRHNGNDSSVPLDLDPSKSIHMLMNAFMSGSAWCVSCLAESER